MTIILTNNSEPLVIKNRYSRLVTQDLSKTCRIISTTHTNPLVNAFGLRLRNGSPLMTYDEWYEPLKQKKTLKDLLKRDQKPKLLLKQLKKPPQPVSKGYTQLEEKIIEEALKHQNDDLIINANPVIMNRLDNYYQAIIKQEQALKETNGLLNKQRLKKITRIRQVFDEIKTPEISLIDKINYQKNQY